MNRIPAYTTPEKFAQDLHAVGLLFDAQEDPREQSIILTNEPMFTKEECMSLTAIIGDWTEEEHENYNNAALEIINEQYRLAHSPALIQQINHTDLYTPEVAAKLAAQHHTPLDAAIAIIRHNMSFDEYGWVCEFIQEYQAALIDHAVQPPTA